MVPDITRDHAEIDVSSVLDGLPYPAVVIRHDHVILASNALYRDKFNGGELVRGRPCYEVSHGYPLPCDEIGESCPLLDCSMAISVSCNAAAVFSETPWTDAVISVIAVATRSISLLWLVTPSFVFVTMPARSEVEPCRISPLCRTWCTSPWRV